MYLKGGAAEREREISREGETEKEIWKERERENIIYLLVHFQNAHNI